MTRPFAVPLSDDRAVVTTDCKPQHNNIKYNHSAVSNNSKRSIANNGSNIRDIKTVFYQKFEFVDQWYRTF